MVHEGAKYMLLVDPLDGSSNTDVNMPLLDGLSLVRELRTLPNYRYKPILLLTTETDPEKKQRARSVGATGWIVKPFNPDKLLAAVRKVLGH